MWCCKSSGGTVEEVWVDGGNLKGAGGVARCGSSGKWREGAQISS